MGKNCFRANVSIMIEAFVRESLAQDVGRGDLYALVERSVECKADIIAKSDGIMAGQKYIEVLARLEGFNIVWGRRDCNEFSKGDVLAIVRGDSHTVLKVERTILNIILHASSIATLTRKYVNILEPYDVKLLDTRKTRPLLRVFS